VLRLSDGAEARRNPAFHQAGAKLDTIGAAILGGQQPFDALDTDLDQR
jgi:hypothetical protein